jgi:hypothetical protein
VDEGPQPFKAEIATGSWQSRRIRAVPSILLRRAAEPNASD